MRGGRRREYSAVQCRTVQCGCGLRNIKLERSEGDGEGEKGKKSRGHRYSSSATIALVGIGYMDWVLGLVGISGLEILDAERRTDEAGAAGCVKPFWLSHAFLGPGPSGGSEDGTGTGTG